MLAHKAHDHCYGNDTTTCVHVSSQLVLTLIDRLDVQYIDCYSIQIYCAGVHTGKLLMNYNIMYVHDIHNDDTA